MALRAAELEILYTANTTGVDQGEKKVRDSAQRIESKPAVKKVDADASEALAGMDRVETEAKKLVSERAVLQLDAEVTRAERELERAQNKVEDLRIRADAGFEVTADVKRAEANLSRLEQKTDRLKALRATVYAEADTSQAEAALDGLSDQAGAAGAEAGKAAGDELGGSLVDALQAIPIAGGVILAGVAIGKAVAGAVQDGLQQEVGFDRLEALTGISPSSALRIGRAAGEAYANVFGDSVEANLDTARLALQFKIIDADTTTRDAQKVVEGIAGIADVLGEEVQPVARAVTQLLRTGLATSAQQAFDIIAAGEREGVNIGEDLLDTLNEYSTQFRKLGLDGPQALGLLSQGLRSGARDSDVAADALKEFAIRAVDPAMKQGFEEVGFSWEDLSRRISEGGPVAAAALDETLDRIRQMPDPAEQAAAAVALFGTQSEDMAAALLGMDLSTAAEQLGQVEGAAQRMFDTLADNDASKIEQAGRNIEVATDAIKGALASVAADPIGEVANFVSENRGPVLSFFADLVTGAFDFGIAIAESSAAGAEGLGRLVSGPLATAVSGLAQVSGFFGRGEDAQALKDLATEMRGFSDETDAAAGFIRDKLVPSLEEGKRSVGGYLEGAVNLGYLNDASLRLADALDVVGDNGEGAKLSLEGVDVANLSASKSGEILERQLVNAASALEEQLAAAEATGEGQDDLTQRYNATRDALISQIEQMGIGRDAAAALVDEVLRTPEKASTAFSSNAPEQQGLVQNLAQRIETLPDGSVVIRADTSPAQAAIDAIQTYWSNRGITIPAYTIRQDAAASARGEGRAYGGPITGPGGPRDDLVPIMASNGEHMLTADEVRGAGGHSAVYRLRQMLAAGSLRLADGGPVTAPPDSTWRTPGTRVDIVERSLAPVMPIAAPAPSAPPARESESGVAVFKLYDASGHLMATMQGVAEGVVESARRSEIVALRSSLASA